MAEQVRRHDARERRVRDRVADERDPAQHDERADDRAHGPDQRPPRRARGRRSRSRAGRGAASIIGASRSWKCALGRAPRRRGGGRRRGRRSWPPRTSRWPPYVAASTFGSSTRLAGPWATIRRLTVAHLLEALRGAGEVVGRRDDRLAAPRLGLEEVHQVLLRGRVDAGHGLVEQVEVGVRGERPGEEHAPPLAARQLTDLHAAVVGHPDLLEGLADRCPIVRSGTAQRPERRIATHHHDVADRDRERPVDELRLRHVGDPAGLPSGRFPEDLDPALPRAAAARPSA